MTNQQATVAIARHPGGPALTTLHLDAQLRVTAVSPDAPAVFGATSPAAMVGRTPWDVAPSTENSPLAHALRDVLETRIPRVVLVPSSIRPGQLAWARVSPVSNGGVRLAFRYERPASRGRKRRAVASAALLLGGMTKAYLAHLA